MKQLLSIKNLFVNVEDKEILKGLNFEVNAGETHVIMGPNGAGKSSLMNAIFGNPKYQKTNGQIVFNDVDITNAKPDEIAKLGVFMSFQNPVSVEGISVFNFIKTAKSKLTNSPINYFDLKDEIDKYVLQLDMREELSKRDLNVGFSGGEKKKAEILQMLSLNPKLAILDETDSGLDVDAIKVVSKGVEMFKNDQNAVLIITHSSRILEHLKVDKVHILLNGKIVKTGDASLVDFVEKNGYAGFEGEN